MAGEEFMPTTYDGTLVVTASATADWDTVVLPTALDDADQSGTPTDPSHTDFSDSLQPLFRRPADIGTYVAMRCVYDDGISSVTSPVVRLFGRASNRDGDGTPGEWQLLANLAGSVGATLTIDTTNDVDYNDDLKATTVNPSTNVWDCMGCDEFRVGVATAIAATGTVSTAFVEAKIY